MWRLNSIRSNNKSYQKHKWWRCKNVNNKNCVNWFLNVLNICKKNMILSYSEVSKLVTWNSKTLNNNYENWCILTFHSSVNRSWIVKNGSNFSDVSITHPDYLEKFQVIWRDFMKRLKWFYYPKNCIQKKCIYIYLSL